MMWNDGTVARSDTPFDSEIDYPESKSGRLERGAKLIRMKRGIMNRTGLCGNRKSWH